MTAKAMFDPTGPRPGSSGFPALLFARAGQEADHLHRQLQALKVVLEILPFHREAVLLVSGGHGREGDDRGRTSASVRQCHRRAEPHPPPPHPPCKGPAGPGGSGVFVFFF